MSIQKCPRRKSSTTLCFVQDGDLALASDRLGVQVCVGCSERVYDICKQCGSSEYEVRQWGVYPGDADHYCAKCGAYIRMRNSG